MPAGGAVAVSAGGSAAPAAGAAPAPGEYEMAFYEKETLVRQQWGRASLWPMLRSVATLYAIKCELKIL